MIVFVRRGLLVVLLGAGCSPTYAPPVRSPQFGAPARTRQGDVAIAGSMVGLHAPTPTYGGPMLAYGLSDAWAIEAGGDFSSTWRMGWGGARYTWAPRRHAKHYLAVDAQAALGAGAGGELWGNDGEESDGRGAFERFAGGGLLGAGVAGHFSFFSVFGRARAQVTKATNIPTTGWWTVGGGIQFRIARTVDLYVQSGPSGYRNSIDEALGTFTEAGVAVRIPTWPWRQRWR